MGGGRGSGRMEEKGGWEGGGRRRKEGGGRRKEKWKEEVYCNVCSTPHENTVFNSITTHIFCRAVTSDLKGDDCILVSLITERKSSSST